MRHSTRRGFLGGAAATGAALTFDRAALAELADLEAEPTAGPFVHGVASGDPLADRVIIWTRVSTPAPAEPVVVGWRMATDPGLRDVVARGTVQTDAERDHTVKVDVTGLEPGRTYYYGFLAFGEPSHTGRTRTAPAGATDRLRFAVVSCSRTWSGFFNGYARIAERLDLDLVIHCGDYIYDEPNREQLVRPDEPTDYAIPKTLEQYRRRHGDYKLDPDLQRAHQQHPWVITMDNHDVGNGNVWEGGGAGEAERSPAWYARKARAIRAFVEWNPIRPPDPADPERQYRELPYGDLVDLVVLDTRLEGRDKPVGTSGMTIRDEAIDDPARTMLGAGQYAWALERMEASKARGARWRVLVNQVLMGQWNAGGLPSTNGLGLDVATRDGGNAFNPIAWDGYTAERRRLFEALRAKGITDNVVVSGDAHCSFALDLVEDPYDPAVYDPATGGRSVGVEFLPTSVTSGNFDEEYDLERAPEAAAAVTAATLGNNPHIRLAEFREHGYGVIDITPERTVGEFWWTPILTRTPEERFGAGFATALGEDHLVPVLEPTRSRPDPPAAAPSAPPEEEEEEGPGTEAGTGSGTERAAAPPAAGPAADGSAQRPDGSASTAAPGSARPRARSGRFRLRVPRDVARGFLARRGVVVRVEVDGPGFVRVLLRGRTADGRTVTLANVLRRVRGAGTYRVRLRPKPALRPLVARRRALRAVTVLARFADARGRKRVARRRTSID